MVTVPEVALEAPSTAEATVLLQAEFAGAKVMGLMAPRSVQRALFSTVAVEFTDEK